MRSPESSARRGGRSRRHVRAARRHTVPRRVQAENRPSRPVRCPAQAVPPGAAGAGVSLRALWLYRTGRHRRKGKRIDCIDFSACLASSPRRAQGDAPPGAGPGAGLARGCRGPAQGPARTVRFRWGAEEGRAAGEGASRPALLRGGPGRAPAGGAGARAGAGRAGAGGHPRPDPPPRRTSPEARGAPHRPAGGRYPRGRARP